METVLEYTQAPITGSRSRQMPADPPTLSRIAVAAFFLINGTLFGTWVSRIPAIQIKRGLSHGTLGLALLAIALGALVAMPLAGRLIARFGSHRITQFCVVFYAALLPVLAVTPGMTWWIVALFCFGSSHGALDVAMNAQAVAVENRYHRPIMSSFHALFSAGGLTGAATGGLAAASGLPPVWHFTLMASALLMAAIAFASPHLLDDREPHAARSPASLQFTLPSRGLVAIGAVAFCAMMGEGAMADWTGIFLKQTLRASESIAAAGYAAFSITMALTRFIGDRLAMRLGTGGLVRLSGGLATAGMALALLSASPTGAMIGFACVGAGFATVVPMAFSAAGRTPGVTSGVALATATTIGYLGFLLGPPLIGFVAEIVGLRGALGLILTTSAMIAVLAPALRGNEATISLPSSIQISDRH